MGQGGGASGSAALINVPVDARLSAPAMKELMNGLARIEAQIVDQIENACNVANWGVDPTPMSVAHMDIGPVPAGGIWQFHASQIDDELLIRCEGQQLRGTYGNPQPGNPGAMSGNLQMFKRGPGVVMLECTNSQAGNWSLAVTGVVGGAQRINWSDGGDDHSFYNRKRFYLFFYDAE